MRDTRKPAIGEIWIKRSYKTVGWPTGRVAITDVVELAKAKQITYHYIAGPGQGRAKKLDEPAFLRMYVHGSTPKPDLIPDPDQAALEFHEHQQAYRGEGEP